MLDRGPSGLIESVNDEPARERLAGMMDERAKRYRSLQGNGLSRNNVGTVVSMLMDLRTGRLYEGANHLYGKHPKPPTDLHPLLQDKLNAILEAGRRDPNGYVYGVDPVTGEVDSGPYPHYSEPGTHSEVQAANQALWDREAIGYEVTPETLRNLSWTTGFRTAPKPGRPWNAVIIARRSWVTSNPSLVSESWTSSR
jgi:hypothetical protein